MEPLHILYIVLASVGAGFVQRVSGFGLGIFIMLFLPHFMPSHTAAAAVSSLCAFCTNTYNTVRYRKSIAYKTALPMLLAAVPSIPVAVYFSAHVSSGVFEIMLGAVLIVLSVYFLVLGERIKLRATTLGGVVSGALGGVLGGLFSTGGPPAVLYLSNATSDNLVYFSTIQFYFCITNLYATAMRAFSGIITKNVLLYAVFGMAGCLLGDLLGKRVFDKLNAKTMKTIIYIGMIISGVLMVI